ncbi:MAG TPA: PadR family transcriptional regulator [Terriglobales bacterium]|nr:PadR family transcriptional regulator [Terriglobales bacterium]
MSKRDVTPHLGMSPAMFQVLLALSDGDKHGYAILKEILRRTGGTVRLSPGTLYGIINRLLQEGLVVESRQRPDPSLDDERRRYYHLTDFGQQVARAEAERLESLVEQARAKRLLPGTEIA